MAVSNAPAICRCSTRGSFLQRISLFVGRVGGAFRASQHLRDRWLINDANQRYALVFFPIQCEIPARKKRSRTVVVGRLRFRLSMGRVPNISQRRRVLPKIKAIFSLSAWKRLAGLFYIAASFPRDRDEQKVLQEQDISETRKEADDLR